MNFAWIERGDVLSLWQPQAYTKDWFGTLAFISMPSTIRHREFSLILDGESSETKAIKTFWSWGKLSLPLAS